jgi:cold shock protein
MPTSDAEMSETEGEPLDRRITPSLPIGVEPAGGDRREATTSLPEQPLGLPVGATVKWFSRSKGYGFVTLSDGSGDGFLPARLLRAIGLDTIEQGTALQVRLEAGERGVRVIEVIARVTSADEPPRPTPEAQEVGTVKWYDAHKGYGFILRDQGGKDIFVHASALQRSRLTGLKEGQRVVVDVVSSAKGPHAVLLRVARQASRGNCD